MSLLLGEVIGADKRNGIFLCCLCALGSGDNGEREVHLFFFNRLIVHVHSQAVEITPCKRKTQVKTMCRGNN